MRKKKVLILCRSDASSDPRPNRMMRWLKESYDVSVLSRGFVQEEGVDFFPLTTTPRTNVERIKTVIFSKSGMFDKLLWSRDLCKLSELLKRERFDLLVVHNLDLVPFALEIRNDAKILFDAREYYPRHSENQFGWRFVYQSFNEYLCERFVNKCDKVITVSNGIAKEYEKEYGMSPEVVMSLPMFCELSPSETGGDRIKIIHHGNATSSRRLEDMISMMDHVGKRFILDLMLMPSNRKYLKYIRKEVAKRPNVRIVPPVKYEEIVPFINQYDIGLYILQPVNFNQRHALPNKFFEFIQARLAVAIGPSEQMKPIVEEHECGVVAKDFSLKTMAATLNSLSVETIRRYKRNSNKASQRLNSGVTSRRVKEIVREMLDHKGKIRGEEENA